MIERSFKTKKKRSWLFAIGTTTMANYVLRTLIVLSLATTVSCATSPRAIQRQVTGGDFQEARSRLERIGAGVNLDPNVSEKDLAVRAFFENEVERIYLRRASNHASEGELEIAISLLDEGLQLCPWSDELSVRYGEYGSRIASVREKEIEWRRVSLSRFGQVESAREFLRDTETLEKDLYESDPLIEINNESVSTIEKHWAEQLIMLSKDETFQIDVSQFMIDTQWDEFESLRATDVYVQLTQVLRLEIEENHDLAAVVAIGSFSEHFDESATGFPSYEFGGRIHSVAADFNEEWFLRNFDIVFDQEPSLDALTLAENVVNKTKSILPDSAQQQLAAFHMQAAQAKSGLGLGSTISLIHIARARQLSPVSETNVRQIFETAYASMSASEALTGKIGITVGPRTDPELGQLMRLTFYDGIVGRTHDHFNWSLTERSSSDFDIVVQVARFIIPDFSSLRTVSSRYHSHNEQVPNPVRTSLEIQVTTARRNLNYAESRYENAVRNHNLNQTQWSYQNATNAYNSYQQAVTNYNRLVNQYNSTPATITRQVYQNYTFKEGVLLFGWDLTVAVGPDGATRSVTVRKVESDFVRQGTHPRDVNHRNRTDDPFEIRVDTNSALRLLSSAVQEILDGLHHDIARFVDIEVRSGLDETDISLVQDILHPWGWDFTEIRTRYPNWVSGALSDIELPDFSPRPRQISLQQSSLPSIRSIGIEGYMEIVKDHSVFLISSLGNSRTTASGALVGPNGLILTCAHCIPGDRIEVVRSDQNRDQAISAEIIFTDQRNDVALIQARGMNNETWLPIRLDRGVSTAEEVFAVGNPSFGDGSILRNVLTKGTVANPNQNSWGSPRIVVDLTIASGSSGGPLVSSIDGHIVGVIAAVSAPEFGNLSTGRSASGSFALAAPSDQFAEWIGLSQ